MGSGVPSGNPVKAGLTASIVVTCTLSGSVTYFRGAKGGRKDGGEAD